MTASKRRKPARTIARPTQAVKTKQDNNAVLEMLTKLVRQSTTNVPPANGGGTSGPVQIVYFGGGIQPSPLPAYPAGQPGYCPVPQCPPPPQQQQQQQHAPREQKTHKRPHCKPHPPPKKKHHHQSEKKKTKKHPHKAAPLPKKPAVARPHLNSRDSDFMRQTADEQRLRFKLGNYKPASNKGVSSSLALGPRSSTGAGNSLALGTRSSTGAGSSLALGTRSSTGAGSSLALGTRTSTLKNNNNNNNNNNNDDDNNSSRRAALGRGGLVTRPFTRRLNRNAAPSATAIAARTTESVRNMLAKQGLMAPKAEPVRVVLQRNGRSVNYGGAPVRVHGSSGIDPVWNPRVVLDRSRATVAPPPVVVYGDGGPVTPTSRFMSSLANLQRRARGAAADPALEAKLAFLVRQLQTLIVARQLGKISNAQLRNGVAALHRATTQDPQMMQDPAVREHVETMKSILGGLGTGILGSLASNALPKPEPSTTAAGASTNSGRVTGAASGSNGNGRVAGAASGSNGNGRVAGTAAGGNGSGRVAGTAAGGNGSGRVAGAATGGSNGNGRVSGTAAGSNGNGRVTGTAAGGNGSGRVAGTASGSNGNGRVSGTAAGSNGSGGTGTGAATGSGKVASTVPAAAGASRTRAAFRLAQRAKSSKNQAPGGFLAGLLGWSKPASGSAQPPASTATASAPSAPVPGNGSGGSAPPPASAVTAPAPGGETAPAGFLAGLWRPAKPAVPSPSGQAEKPGASMISFAASMLRSALSSGSKAKAANNGGKKANLAAPSGSAQQPPTTSSGATPSPSRGTTTQNSTNNQIENPSASQAPTVAPPGGGGAEQLSVTSGGGASGAAPAVSRGTANQNSQLNGRNAAKNRNRNKTSAPQAPTDAPPGGGGTEQLSVTSGGGATPAVSRASQNTGQRQSTGGRPATPATAAPPQTLRASGNQSGMALAQKSSFYGPGAVPLGPLPPVKPRGQTQSSTAAEPILSASRSSGSGSRLFTSRPFSNGNMRNSNELVRSSGSGSRLFTSRPFSNGNMRNSNELVRGEFNPARRGMAYLYADQQSSNANTEQRQSGSSTEVGQGRTGRTQSTGPFYLSSKARRNKTGQAAQPPKWPVYTSRFGRQSQQNNSTAQKQPGLQLESKPSWEIAAVRPQAA